MQQRTFDFDKLPHSDTVAIAKATSLPPPPLVRPDRQLTFDGSPHYDWPAPTHDRDTISVDRIRNDIDGPSHRFIIHRGDTVEVFFSPTRVELGEVTGISHRNHEVRVAFSEQSEGIWFQVGCIYPTAEELPRSVPERGVPLSQIISAISVEPEGGFTEADRVPCPVSPYTFDDYKSCRKRFAEASLTYDDYQAEFKRLCQSQVAIVSEMKARFKAAELAVIASRMGSFDAKRSTKDQNANSIYHRMISSFVLDGAVSYSIGERYEEAVKRKVEAVTPEEFALARENRTAKANELEKALTNPETFYEFRTFLQTKSEADLSDAQLARYDALHGDITRERRSSAIPSTVERFQSDELNDYQFQLKEGFHDKRQCAVWIVQLASRVERATFDELNRKAKMLGGWFSSYKKADAGFQFLVKESADSFCALISDNVDRQGVLDARRERRELSAAERLHELANELSCRADEAIEQSNQSLQNTARRADIQAGVRGRAYADQALSRTMHSIAESLSRGDAKYLDGLRHKTQIETLDSVLHLAKWSWLRKLRQQSHETTNLRLLEELPINASVVRYAEFPYPSIYRRHLEEAAQHCRNTKGSKQAAERMTKRLRCEKEDFVAFRRDHDIESLTDFLSRAKGAGANVEWIEMALEKYNRLQRANITDIHELRSALREYLCHRAEARGDDPVKVAERELIGKELPGFYPTPRPIIDMLLERADIGEQHRVLEPSCGKGDILDAIRAQHSGCQLHAIERNQTLSDILSVKGHAVEFADFLHHSDHYDRIVMNPPFESGQDIEHVRHAYDLLTPDGRLVAVMSEGPFFRGDNKAINFRKWLEAVSAEVEPLPEDAFMGADSFRQTAVRTRLVTISKDK